jgi:hypothetical protein
VAKKDKEAIASQKPTLRETLHNLLNSLQETVHLLNIFLTLQNKKQSKMSVRDKLQVSCAEAAAMLTTSEEKVRLLVKTELLERMNLFGADKYSVKELERFRDEAQGKSIRLDAPVEEIKRNLKSKAKPKLIVEEIS